MDNIETLLNALPAPTARFTPKRKLAIMAAIAGGAITLADAASRYALTESELMAWHESNDFGGRQALRVTRCQMYRQAMA